MKHFVLVHGLGHGAWCWYKLVLLLRRAGHRVTAVDLDGGCGGDASIDDYVKPLMDLMRSIDVDDDDEKVILVGHSFGGMPISIAMERFPEKISVAVFVSAYMPNCSSPPLTLVQEVRRHYSFNPPPPYNQPRRVKSSAHFLYRQRQPTTELKIFCSLF